MNLLKKYQLVMKTFFCLLVCLPIMSFGQSVVAGLHDTHNQLVGGLPHGNWFLISKTIDNDTIIMKKTVYDMGYKLSDTIYDIKANKLIQTINYKDGLENGTSNEYWPNGQLRGEVSYNRGVVNGIVKSYSTNGELLTQLLFVNGEEDLNYSDRYLSGTISVDTSYVGFNQPVWKYYAKYDTITVTDFCWFDSLVEYYKNNNLYKENAYDYQGRLYSTTKYTNGVKDTVYDFYTKKNYNGLQCIHFYQAGKLTKTVYYDTQGRIFKNQKYGERKALGWSSYKVLKKWRRERDRYNVSQN